MDGLAVLFQLGHRSINGSEASEHASTDPPALVFPHTCWAHPRPPTSTPTSVPILSPNAHPGVSPTTSTFAISAVPRIVGSCIPPCVTCCASCRPCAEQPGLRSRRHGPKRTASISGPARFVAPDTLRTDTATRNNSWVPSLVNVSTSRKAPSSDGNVLGTRHSHPQAPYCVRSSARGPTQTSNATFFSSVWFILLFSRTSICTRIQKAKVLGLVHFNLTRTILAALIRLCR